MNHIANLKREQRRKEIQEYLAQHPEATLKEVGTLLGVTSQRAHILLKRVGIRTRCQRNKHLAEEHETEILQYMARGYTNEELAAKFGVSWHTMQRQVWVILAKFKAKSRAQAVRLAKQQGLI